MFLECEHTRRKLTCLREEIKPHVSSWFDLEGLDGNKDFLESDVDRAMAVLLAEEAVGYDDYNLSL